MRERITKRVKPVETWDGSPEPSICADGSGEPSHKARASIIEQPAAARVCQNVTAAILAGGLGTRLRPAIDGIPKVLARVNGRPFITFLLEKLAKAGIERAVLLTGYQADQVRQTLGKIYDAMTLSYSAEAAPLGTAGALRQALPKLKTESILLLNGDSYCDVDISKLVSAHQRRRANITMALVRVSDTGRFGRVKTTADGKITQFGEKQTHAGAGWINAGVYVLARSLITSIPGKQSLSLEREVLPNWINSERCFGFKTKGRFLDIGTPASYAAATFFFSAHVAEVVRLQKAELSRVQLPRNSQPTTH